MNLGQHFSKATALAMDFATFLPRHTAHLYNVCRSDDVTEQGMSPVKAAAYTALQEGVAVSLSAVCGALLSMPSHSNTLMFAAASLGFYSTLKLVDGFVGTNDFVALPRTRALNEGTPNLNV